MTTKTFHKYYCLEKAPEVGNIPRGVCGMKAFDGLTLVSEIMRPAYGYVVYEWPLSELELMQYNLVEEKK